MDASSRTPRRSSERRSNPRRDLDGVPRVGLGRRPPPGFDSLRFSNMRVAPLSLKQFCALRSMQEDKSKIYKI